MEILVIWTPHHILVIQLGRKRISLSTVHCAPVVRENLRVSLQLSHIPCWSGSLTVRPSPSQAQAQHTAVVIHSCWHITRRWKASLTSVIASRKVLQGIPHQKIVCVWPLSTVHIHCHLEQIPNLGSKKLTSLVLGDQVLRGKAYHPPTIVHCRIIRVIKQVRFTTRGTWKAL